MIYIYMKKPSKKLYQKVTNKPKKFGNNNVNSINIILNPHEESGSTIKQLQRPSGGAGPQVLQELSRITPPSLEDARQILGRAQQKEEDEGKTISEIQRQGVANEVAEVINNAQIAEQVEAENVRYAEQIERQQNTLSSLADLAIQTDATVDDETLLAREEANRVQQRLTAATDELMRSYDNQLLLEEERNAYAQELEELKEAYDYMRGELAGIDEATQSLRNRIPVSEELTPPQETPSVNIFETPPPTSNLGFFGENRDTSLMRAREAISRERTRQVPLPASFGGQFAMGTDVPERANRPVVPRKKSKN